MIVRLTWFERRIALSVGRERAARAAARNSTEIIPRPQVYAHAVGAAGELAFAKALGVYWNFSVDTFRSAPDVAGYEVRTRTNPEWDLFIRPNDSDNRKYALVTIDRDKSFLIVGYLLGADAKQRRWLRDYGNRGKSAYFVPQAALLPIPELHPPLQVHA